MLSTRNARLAAAATGLFLATLLRAQTPVSGPVASVTVYPDRAFVTRTVQVQVAAGLNEFSVSDLPVQLNDRSLQVGGSGVAGLSLLDATVRMRFSDVAASAEARDLRKRIDELAEQIRSMDDRIFSLEQQRTFISKLSPPSLTPVSGAGGTASVKVEDLAAFVSFVDGQLTRILPAIADAERERGTLGARKAALEQELERLNAGQARQSKAAVIRLNADAPGSAVLTVSYQVPGASWSPLYQVRAVADSQDLELTYDAQVYQNTGENWDRVALVLSTARPSLGGSAPESEPWIVDAYQQRPAENYAVRESAAPASAMMDFSAKGASERQISSVGAGLAAGLTSAAFRISAPATVSADGSPQRVSITRIQLKGSFEHRVTPRLSTTVFLHAKASNSSDFPLLPGSLAIFLDGSYVAESSIGQVMPGEAFELALGPDEGVKVERKLLNRFSEVVGITQSTTRVSYDFATTVTNARKSAIKLVMSDVVPVSRNEKIVVAVKSPSDRDKSVARGDEGRLTWTLDLKPAEKRVVPLQFAIEHPTSLPVLGLE